MDQWHITLTYLISVFAICFCYFLVVRKTKNLLLSLFASPFYLFITSLGVAGAIKEIMIVKAGCLVCLVLALYELKKLFVRKQTQQEIKSFRKHYYVFFISTAAAALFEILQISFLPVQLFPLCSFLFLGFRYLIRHHVPICLKERIEVPSLRVGGIVEKIEGDQIVLRDLTAGVIVLPLVTLWKEGYIISSRRTHQKLELKVEVPFSELGELSQVKGLIKEYVTSHPFIDGYYPCNVYIDEIQKDRAIFQIEGKSFISSNATFIEKKEEILLEVLKIIKSHAPVSEDLLRSGHSG